MDGIIDNLTNAIQTWNEKMAEIWLLLTQSPQEFKGGVIWEVIQNIHGALQSIGIALLVLFFVFGIVKTLTNMMRSKDQNRHLNSLSALRLPGESLFTAWI